MLMLYIYVVFLTVLLKSELTTGETVDCSERRHPRQGGLATQASAPEREYLTNDMKNLKGKYPQGHPRGWGLGWRCALNRQTFLKRPKETFKWPQVQFADPPWLWRGNELCSALPWHKKGTDHPPAGSPRWECLMSDPKHPVTPGTSLKMCPGFTSKWTHWTKSRFFSLKNSLVSPVTAEDNLKNDHLAQIHVSKDKGYQRVRSSI